MGWEKLNEAPDPEREAGIDEMNAICREAEENPEPEPDPDPAREGIDWVRDDLHEERLLHPLAKRSLGTRG